MIKEGLLWIFLKKSSAFLNNITLRYYVYDLLHGKICALDVTRKVVPIDDTGKYGVGKATKTDFIIIEHFPQI